MNNKNTTVAKRTLGKSGLAVSEIGLACAPLGGAFGVEENIRAFAVLAATDREGMYFLDTADIYGSGLSESRIGAWQKQHAAPRLVASKAGRGPEMFPGRHQYDRMRRSVEGTLERLQLDHLDLLHLHRLPKELLQNEQVWHWLDDFRKEGLIKHYGVCVDTLDEANISLDRPHLTSVQIALNVLHQAPLERFVARANAQGVGIIARQPFAHGLLCNAAFPTEPDERKRFSYLTRSRLQQKKLVDRLRELVPSGMTLEQMVLRWLLDQEGIASVLVTAVTPDQVTSYAKASHLPALNKSLHQQLHEFYEENLRSATA